MIQFEDSFFEGEYRDGFYVEPMMKRVWAAQMEVLMDIKSVCEKYGIRYFADWGTMLGAVRHHGFVPWDDDMDIGMLRPDYQKFISIAQKELPAGYSVLNLHTEPDFDHMLTRVVNSRAICVTEPHLEKYHGCPYVIGIDIFPIDYIPRNKEEETVQKHLISIVLSVVQLMEWEDSDPDEIQDALDEIQNLCRIQFSKDEPLKKQLYELGERLCGLYGEEDADEVTSMCDLVNGWDYHPAKSCYEKSILMPFENIQIPVPVGYDEVLKVKYGDYMTPVKQAGGHDYPFYISQKKILAKCLAENGLSGERFYIDQEFMDAEI